VPLICDLADLSSVRRAAAEAAEYGPLDILVNNAGVMATPNRRTVDGFDLQLATNHLGHFALTGLLLPQLVASNGARVVTLASLAHHWVRSVPLTDPREPTGRYSKWIAYARSKLANLLFAFELDRRARQAGLPVTSVAAHPGYAATDLTRGGLRIGGRTPVGTMLDAATRLLGQTSAQGAMPSLMAATMPGLPGGAYVGPGGPGEVRGPPMIVGTTSSARDEQMAAQLWDVSEHATGVSFSWVRGGGGTG
jgi:NAD(P)-dependent dehydrogenase (short-subunit alcohol dehydrogenase family)